MIKVLYVEDEIHLGRIVKESLEARDFEVHMVSDGLQAVPVFNDYAPDICVLDVMLPGKDGFSIGREIRQRNPIVPIIFLTAKDQTDDLLEGFRSGGNDYLKKPFSLEELIVRMQNLLQLTHMADSGNQMIKNYRFGHFKFDHKRLLLQHPEKTIKLSHKEGQLLKILVDQLGETIDRKRILNEIWGDDHFFHSRNLDVYIRKLRKLLSSDPTVQIVTLKGIGYRLIQGLPK